MRATRLHADEHPIDVALAHRLLRDQLPRWADEPLAPVPSSGTDHVLVRLGHDKVVRLPRVAWAVGQAEREHVWLPRLAPHVPLAVPEPLALGEPGEGYPWRWSVHRWIEGDGVAPGALADPVAAARSLAAFVRALGAVDVHDGPPAGEGNAGRGLPLATRDAAVRRALAELSALDDEPLDLAAANAAWEESLAAVRHAGPPRWVHGDLQGGNLIARDGRLVAVIDFGCLGVGDPAVDLMVAWNLFDRPARAAYRAALGADDASWARGRGWALSMALIALPYYRRSIPAIAEQSRRTIAAVLEEGR